MSYRETTESGMFIASIDNTGAYERPTFGTLKIRRNSLHLAASRDDFTVNDTPNGRKTAAEAMERGMLVFDLAGNLLSAEDLKEAE